MLPPIRSVDRISLTQLLLGHFAMNVHFPKQLIVSIHGARNIGEQSVFGRRYGDELKAPGLRRFVGSGSPWVADRARERKYLFLFAIWRVFIYEKS